MKNIFVIIAIIFINSSIYSQGNIEGFGNIKWGSLLSDVKGNVLGKITYTDEKKIIISRDGDIEYLYGFFYKEAEIGEQEISQSKAAAQTKETASQANEADIKSKESRLFYVSVKFPYLIKDDVKKKIEEKYGPATGEDIKENKGAIIWDSGNTTIIMWVDDYEKKPYCMKINYLSKEIAKEVNDYLKIIFNTKEIEVFKRLSL